MVAKKDTDTDLWKTAWDRNSSFYFLGTKLGCKLHSTLIAYFSLRDHVQTTTLCIFVASCSTTSSLLHGF